LIGTGPDWPLAEDGAPVGTALSLAHAIDRISRIFGVIATWLVLLSALVSAFNSVFRYSTSFLLFLEHEYGLTFFGALVRLYGNNSNTLSESTWYMFAGMVMLGGPWTLKANEHVRVDVLYGSVPERVRTWIDLLGGLFFLAPLCILMIYFTWPWFWQSYLTNEGSLNAGGLIRWPVKILVPVGFALMGLQAISEIIKCIAALTTSYVREAAYEKPLQ
jgi:TRAP-type mannitol/chloroaromatic compound transport system permease small subunit